jgi:predicted CoA-substrate-specific enzyme activase
MKKIQPVFSGIDVGASHTKVVILDRNKNIIGRALTKSGTDFTAAAERCLQESLATAGVSKDSITATIASGYGRKNVAFADDIKTEIGCHAKGCYHYFPTALTIIDIGGQDNKIIKIDNNGMRTGFKMNRKCAAGTGAFLEEMSLRLNIPLEEMNDLAVQSENLVELGSFCTVFSATEVLEKISQGKKVPDIVKGIFLSVIKRIIEMDSFTERVAITGGVVAHNPYLATMIEEIIGRNIQVPEYPQFTGAVGAALFAIDYKNSNK